MSTRSEIMGLLFEAPATTREIALELWGGDSRDMLRRVSWHISAMRQAGIPVVQVGEVEGFGNRPLKLWSIREGE